MQIGRRQGHHGRSAITPAPEHFVLQPPLCLDAVVPIVTTYSGMPSTAIASVLEATGVRGLVVQGTGAGNVPGSIEPALRETVDAGIVVEELSPGAFGTA
jgi:L-asparaginase